MGPEESDSKLIYAQKRHYHIPKKILKKTIIKDLPRPGPEAPYTNEKVYVLDMGFGIGDI